MKNKVCMVCILFAVATGCQDAKETDKDVKLSDLSRLELTAVLKAPQPAFSERVQSFVDTIADDEQRLADVRALGKRLLSIDLDGESYSDQQKMLRRISHLIESTLVFCCLHANEIETRYELRLAILDWYRRQLVGLKPNQTNNSEVLVWPGDEVVKRFDEWYGCYLDCFRRYRGLVNQIEFWWYPKDIKTMSQSSADALTARIEATLGRPIRKPSKDRETDWHWETEEFRGVKEHRLLRIEQEGGVKR